MPVDGATVVDRPLLGENEPVRGIYLHMPFCARKCSYCDFYSVAASSPAMTEFRGLLTREMDMVRNRFPEDAAATADTVYFGGGTPTVFPPEALCRLLSAIRERFPVEPDAEITVEANPGTVTAEGLRAMREGGFTRVSIGVQSFTPAPPGTAFYGLRTANTPSLAEYGKGIREGRLPFAEVRACDSGDAWKESLIFGLRMTDGVDLGGIEKRIGAPPDPLRDAVADLTRTGRALPGGAR